MSITLSTTPPESTQVVERTFEVMVSVRLGEKPMITARREQVEMKGQEISRLLTNAITVQREFTTVAPEPVTVAGAPVTVADLWQAIAGLFDRWSVEDQKNKQQPPAA